MLRRSGQRVAEHAVRARRRRRERSRCREGAVRPVPDLLRAGEGAGLTLVRAAGPGATRGWRRACRRRGARGSLARRVSGGVVGTDVDRVRRPARELAEIGARLRHVCGRHAVHADAISGDAHVVRGGRPPHRNARLGRRCHTEARRRRRWLAVPAGRGLHPGGRSGGAIAGSVDGVDVVLHGRATGEPRQRHDGLSRRDDRQLAPVDAVANDADVVRGGVPCEHDRALAGRGLAEPGRGGRRLRIEARRGRNGHVRPRGAVACLVVRLHRDVQGSARSPGLRRCSGSRGCVHARRRRRRSTQTRRRRRLPRPRRPRHSTASPKSHARSLARTARSCRPCHRLHQLRRRARRLRGRRWWRRQVPFAWRRRRTQPPGVRSLG